MSQHKVIDARGAYCPGPLMELIAALKLIEIGDEIEVVAEVGMKADTEIQQMSADAEVVVLVAVSADHVHVVGDLVRTGD